MHLFAALAAGSFLLAIIILGCASKPNNSDWDETWLGYIAVHFDRPQIKLYLKEDQNGMVNGALSFGDEGENFPLMGINKNISQLSFRITLDGTSTFWKGTIDDDVVRGKIQINEQEGQKSVGMFWLTRHLVQLGSAKYPAAVPQHIPSLPEPTSIGRITDAEKAIFLPFYSQEESKFEIARTYYVAANEPGASNENNGLYPDYRGGRDGPFKDLNDWDRVRGKLYDAEDGVKMVLRKGEYVVRNIGEDGLVLNGNGDASHPIILTGYPGETAILTSTPDVTVTIQIHGQYGILQNLIITSVGDSKWNVIVTGDKSIIRNCVFMGPVHQDSLKIGNEANNAFIFNNDISWYGSQAVDNFGHNILVKKNRIHHDASGKGNAVGTKGGTRNMVVAHNVFHDLNGGITFGGTGDLKKYRKDKKGDLLHATINPVAVENTFYNIAGSAVYFQSALNGVFQDNTVYDTVAGFRVGLDADVFNTRWKKYAVGLPKTRGTIIRNNRMANILGGDVFLVEEYARQGLVSENNIYYTDSELISHYRNQELRRMPHAEFQEKLELDQTSVVKLLEEFKP